MPTEPTETPETTDPRASERAPLVLVLDFDGTVCTGDAPVLLYGSLLNDGIRALPGHEDADILPALRAYLEVQDRAALRASRRDDLDDAIDGYAAAQLLARREGLGPEGMEAAYQTSRQALARAGDVDTAPPPGLAELLASLPATVRRVLVTNAPEAGIAAQLEHLGLAEVIDEVVPSARKPAGMTAILHRLLADAGIADSPQRLLSVGDIWVNDLEPAAAIGARTALIDRHGAGLGEPDLRGPDFPSLYVAIADWARED